MDDENFSFDTYVLENDNLNDEFNQNSEQSYDHIDECIDDTFIESFSLHHMSRPTKKQRLRDPTPIVFGTIRTKKGTDRKSRTIKILLDSGGSSTIVKHDIVKELRINNDNNTLWTTTAGKFSRTGVCKVNFKLPELDTHAVINTKVHVTKNDMNYDMIIGRDLLRELGIDILFSTESVQYNETTIPM